MRLKYLRQKLRYFSSVQIGKILETTNRDVAIGGCGGVTSPTFETWESSGKFESLHHQNQVVFEDLRAL